MAEKQILEYSIYNELSAVPSTPPTGFWKIYPRSGSWYVLNSIGTEIPLGGVPGGTNTQLQYNNSGVFAGSLITTDGTNLTVPSGSRIKSSSNVHNSQIDVFNSEMLDGLNHLAISWSVTNRKLYDTGGIDYTIDWDRRIMRDSNSNTSVDWDSRLLYGNLSGVDWSMINGIDATKVAQFDTSLIATGITRTFTFPDQSGTFVLLSDLTGFGTVNKYATTFTPGTVSTPNTITHSLGTTDIIIQLVDITTGEMILADTIGNYTINTVDITFTVNPAGNVRVIITG